MFGLGTTLFLLAGDSLQSMGMCHLVSFKVCFGVQPGPSGCVTVLGVSHFVAPGTGSRLQIRRQHTSSWREEFPECGIVWFMVVQISFWGPVLLQTSHYLCVDSQISHKQDRNKEPTSTLYLRSGWLQIFNIIPLSVDVITLRNFTVWWKVGCDHPFMDGLTCCSSHFVSAPTMVCQNYKSATNSKRIGTCNREYGMRWFFLIYFFTEIVLWWSPEITAHPQTRELSSVGEHEFFGGWTLWHSSPQRSLSSPSSIPISAGVSQPGPGNSSHPSPTSGQEWPGNPSQ